MTTKDQSSPSARSTGAVLYRDPNSFQKAFDEAIAACTAILTEAVRKVAGTEAALRGAMNDFKALRTFEKAVEKHIKNASFHELPVVRNGRHRIEGMHQLTCGPFRGVFLIGRDPNQVIALLFSRKPHDVSKRMIELAASYRGKEEEDTGGDA